MKVSKLGRWAFVIGILVSIVIGIGGSFSYAPLILVILGLIVGFMNISEKKAHHYLVAVIALMVVGVAYLQALAVIGNLYNWLQAILTNFISFVAASALVVAIKSIFEATDTEV